MILTYFRCLINRPGRLFNIVTFKVGTHSNWAVIFGEVIKSFKKKI